MSLCHTLSQQLTHLNNLHQQLAGHLNNGTLEDAHNLKTDIKKISDSFNQTINQAKEHIIKELIGQEHYLGPEAIQQTYGFYPQHIPEIPYTREQLLQAKKLGERLILRVSHDSEGNPLTLERLEEIRKSRTKEPMFGYIVNRNQPYFTSEPSHSYWALVGGDLLKDSTDKNYIDQTKLLRDHLKKLGSLTKEEEEECTDAILDKLKKEMSSGWDGRQSVPKKLSSMEINQKHRRSPRDIIYDETMQYKVSGKRGFLENKCEWSPTLSSNGHLVRIGEFCFLGVYFHDEAPDFGNGYTGSVSIR